MKINIKLDAKKALDASITAENLKGKIDSLLTVANKEASQKVLDDIIAEYIRKNDSNEWRGPNHIPWKKSGEWGKKQAYSWYLKELRNDGFVIDSNSRDLEAVTRDRIIRPKKGRYLAIPLISDSKGISPRMFSKSVAKLFPFRRNKDSEYTAAMFKSGKKIVAAYLYVREVKQKAWANALIPSNKLSDMYYNAMTKYFPL